MTSIAFRSPVTVPLHRKGWVRPRGNHDFRVTAGFNDPDLIQPSQRHNAVDIGNARCNDPIVAMAPGTARRLFDPAGALGIGVIHAPNVETRYWHFNSISVGNNVAVQAGRELGRNGNTGNATGCHTHVELWVDGVRRDPEPYMFGATLVLGARENDVKILGHNPRALVNLTTTIKNDGRGGNVRSGPGREYPVLETFPDGIVFRPVFFVRGEKVGDEDRWAIGGNYLAKGGWHFVYAHYSILEQPFRVQNIVRELSDAEKQKLIQEGGKAVLGGADAAYRKL